MPGLAPKRRQRCTGKKGCCKSSVEAEVCIETIGRLYELFSMAGHFCAGGLPIRALFLIFFSVSLCAAMKRAPL